MSTRKILNSHYTMRMLETGGCGAVIGAIAFTIIAGFITNAEQVPLMTYSPLIGGVCGGAVSFLIALAADFRKIKEFQEKMAHLEKNQKIGFQQWALPFSRICRCRFFYGCPVIRVLEFFRYLGFSRSSPECRCPSR